VTYTPEQLRDFAFWISRHLGEIDYQHARKGHGSRKTKKPGLLSCG
jgi:hypothetical protein